MASRDGHIKLTVTYTAVTDVNHLLGRPGQYTSKASFSDDLIPAGDTTGDESGDVDFGGGVEGFASAADRDRRAHYLADVTGAVSAFAEYDYVAGHYLLRLSHYLTPAQASGIEADFSAVVGSPAVVVSPSAA